MIFEIIFACLDKGSQAATRKGNSEGCFDDRMILAWCFYGVMHLCANVNFCS